MKKVFLLYLLFITSSSGGSFLDSANTLYNSGRLKEAIIHYKKAINNGENRALCLFNMANSYVKEDNFAQAIVAYRECCVAAPHFFRSYFNLATLYYTLGDEAACMGTLSQAINLEPENTQAWLLMASAAHNAGSISDAITLYQRALSLDSTLYDIYLILGELFHSLQDNHQAINLIQKYPDHADKFYYANNILADIYLEDNKLDKAIFYLRRSWNYSTNKNRWVLYKIIDILNKSGNAFVALDEAREGIHLFPDFVELSLLAGNIATENKMYDIAEYFYQRAKDNNSPAGIVGLENLKKLRE